MYFLELELPEYTKIVEFTDYTIIMSIDNTRNRGNCKQHLEYTILWLTKRSLRRTVEKIEAFLTTQGSSSLTQNNKVESMKHHVKKDG